MVDQAYNDETQRAAVPNVNKSQDAVKTTANASDAQSAAQTHSVWGDEDGPSAFRNSVADMFRDIADILKKENDLISTFETNVHLTMEEAKGVEWDNQQALSKVNDMLDNVASSNEAEALAKQLEEKKYMDKRAEPLKAATVAPPSQTDPSQTGAATGQPDPSQNATSAPTPGSQDES